MISIDGNSFYENLSKDNQQGYRGILGCFDYLVKTKNQKEDYVIKKQRELREKTLIGSIKNPGELIVKEMVEEAFKHEIRARYQNDEDINELIQIGEKLGFEKEQIQEIRQEQANKYSDA